MKWKEFIAEVERQLKEQGCGDLNEVEFEEVYMAFAHADEVTHYEDNGMDYPVIYDIDNNSMKIRVW